MPPVGLSTASKFVPVWGPPRLLSIAAFTTDSANFYGKFLLDREQPWPSLSIADDSSVVDGSTNADDGSVPDRKLPLPRLSIADDNSFVVGSINANGEAVPVWKPPWLSLGVASKFIAIGNTLTDANDIGNEARLDSKYTNAWFLLPPWPDDDGREGALPFTNSSPHCPGRR